MTSGITSGAVIIKAKPFDPRNLPKRTSTTAAIVPRIAAAVAAQAAIVRLKPTVGAIKVAVEAGAEAAKKLGVFVSSHVIARPDEMVSKMIEENSITTIENINEEITEKKDSEIEEIKMEVQEEVKIEETEIIEKSVDTLAEKPMIKENKSKRK